MQSVEITAKQASKHDRLHPKLMENRLVDRMVGGFVMYVHQKVSLIFFISQGKEVERYPAEV